MALEHRLLALGRLSLGETLREHLLYLCMTGTASRSAFASLRKRSALLAWLAVSANAEELMQKNSIAQRNAWVRKVGIGNPLGRR